MHGVAGALLLGGSSLLAGSAVYLLAHALVGHDPVPPNTPRSLARKLRFTRMAMVLAAAAVCAGIWLDR